jgi:predicted nucleotidyltransferase component of viral defense system
VVAKEEYVKSRFYLTGGTALSGYYYNHRESLDLDFFSPKKFELAKIVDFLFRSQSVLHWKRIYPYTKHGEGSFALVFADGELITDFVFYAFPTLEKCNLWKGMLIESKLDIAVNKLNVILQRKYLRDYIDLYFLMKKEKFTLDFLRKKLVTKYDWQVDPITLSKHLLKVAELSDIPKMYVPFSKMKMVKFFEKEARKLEPEIFK